jgi:hypothetical protein
VQDSMRCWCCCWPANLQYDRATQALEINAACLCTAAEDAVLLVLTAAATAADVCACRAGGVPSWSQPPRCGWPAEAVPHGVA